MVGQVASIVVPDPPALSPVAQGANTQGHAYALTMPGLATDPLTVTNRDGQTFTWRPTELAYRDAAGQMDYVVGSAPASIALRGREARYTRLFPTSDDVFIAQAEQIKHWTILNEPPRSPAVYLGSGVEFGVTGVVGGIPLPPGFHDELEVFGFKFPRPVAWDLTGATVYGRYEVVDTTDGQQLFTWFPADFFASATYPVMIDPTLIATGQSPLYGPAGRRMCELSDGTLVIAIATASDTRVYISKDSGTTWSTVTSPASGIVSTLRGYLVMDRDEDNRVHVLIGGDELNTNLVYQQWTFSGDRMTITVAQTQVEAAAGSIYYWALPDITVWGAAGATKNLAMCYDKVNGGDTTSTMYLYARTATVTTAGVITLDTRYTKDSVARGGGVYYPALSRKSDNTVKILWSMDSTNPGGPFIKVATISGGATTLSAVTNIQYTKGIDGFPGFYWAATEWDRLVVYDDVARKGASASNWTDQNWYPTAVPDVTNNRIIIFAKRGTALANPNYPGWFEFGTVGNTFTDKGALNTTIQASGRFACPRRNSSESKAHMAYTNATAQNDVYYDFASFNVAPNAPILTAEPNFDATDAQTLAWTFSDPDPGDTQSAYQLVIIRVWDGTTVVDTGKVASGTASYALAGSTLANPSGSHTGQYQWKVRTWDAADTVGAYSSLGSFYTSAKPTATITVPAADGATVSSSSLTAEWSTSDPESEGQSAYQVRLTDNADVELWTSGKVSSVSGRSQTIGYTLVISTNYKVKITVWDAKDVASTEVVRTFVTSFTVPAIPVLTVIPYHEGARNTLAMTNPTPTGGQPTVTGNDVYRRIYGDTAWTRITANVDPNGTYDDYAVASDVTYQYMVRALGANNTTSDSAIKGAQITITHGVWLHDPLSPATTLHHFEYREVPLQDTRKPTSGEFRFAGRSAPTVQFDGSMQDRSLRVRVALPDDTTDRAALETLFARLSTLCFRDFRSRKLYVALKELPIGDELRFGWADLDLFAVSYEEAV